LKGYATAKVESLQTDLMQKIAADERREGYFDEQLDYEIKERDRLIQKCENLALELANVNKDLSNIIGQIETTFNDMFGLKALIDSIKIAEKELRELEDKIESNINKGEIPLTYDKIIISAIKKKGFGRIATPWVEEKERELEEKREALGNIYNKLLENLEKYINNETTPLEAGR